MNNKKSFLAKLVGAPYYVWATMFIVIPMAIVLYYAFTDNSGAFTLGNIDKIVDNMDTILLSIILGAVATVVCLILAFPIAYIISKMSASTQKIVLMLIMLPMWINLLLRTYALMNIFGNEGIINSILEVLNLPKVEILGTYSAVIMGMVYNFLPYMVLPIYTAISKIDNSVLEASKDLGSNGLQTITKVLIPLSLPGIISGITMVFVPSVSSFYVPEKLGNGMKLIGNVIQDSRHNYHTVASLSFVLMFLILVCMAVMNKFTDDEEETIVL